MSSSKSASTNPGPTNGPDVTVPNLSVPDLVTPGLYIVATPIGNARDISFRALDILRAADLVACEDTRVSGRFLQRFDIRSKLAAYHDHNAAKVRPRLIERMNNGETVALISDAGTPLISDPGFKLVADARAAGIPVTPVPGASAALAALMAAGLPTDRFLFSGFLPAKKTARCKVLAELAGIDATLIFYESPRRLAATLADMAHCLGQRDAVIARELTKLHEEWRRGGLEELHHHYADLPAPKGEIVILVAPPSARAATEPAIIDAELKAALQDMSLKDASAMIASRHNQPRKEIYGRALALRRQQDEDQG